MGELLHRVKVFVYRMRGPNPDYLLLKSAPGIEGFWGPVHGNIAFGENLERAIRREVHDDTGIARPQDLIDLQMPARWVFGDEVIIEWHYGFHALHEGEDELKLDPRFEDFRWEAFSRAYPSLELDDDRAAITRLHAMLHAA